MKVYSLLFAATITASLLTTWGRASAAACTTTCNSPGCSEKTIPAGGSWTLVKSISDCMGSAYPSTMTLTGQASADEFVVSFNNNLKPSSTSSASACSVSYADPVGRTLIKEDVEIEIKCKDASKPCVVQASEVNWDCFLRPGLAGRFTRTKMEGANCNMDQNACENRCAMNYMVGAKFIDYVFAPQFTAGCECKPVWASAVVDKTGSFENTETGLYATFINEGGMISGLTMEYSGTGKTCKSTYAMKPFTSSFIEATYTRKSATPSDCVKAEDCDYKCAAEFALTKGEVDTIKATQPTVAGCQCNAVEAVVDGTGAMAFGTVKGVDFAYIVTNAGVTLNTTVAGKTCQALYTAPGTGKTGTSAGVSALGEAAAVTVTLVAAAAGVQAFGMPA